MNDYEKFDQDLNQGVFGDEFSDLKQIVKSLEQGVAPPSAAAERASRLRMLAEVDTIKAEDSVKRGRRLGAIFAWAVPAILILAVAGVMFGNGSGDNVNGLVPGSEGEEAPGILATAVPYEEEDSVEIEATITLTPTRIVTDDAPLSQELPEGVDRSTVISDTNENGSSITLPLDDGTEIEVPQPVLPVSGGGAGQPVDTEGGSDSETSGAPEE